MPNLDSQKAYDLATNYDNIAKAIGEYIIMNHDSLSEKEREDLKKQHAARIDMANELHILSDTLVLDDVEASLATIYELSKQIKTDFMHIHSIQKAIK